MTVNPENFSFRIRKRIGKISSFFFNLGLIIIAVAVTAFAAVAFFVRYPKVKEMNVAIPYSTISTGIEVEDFYPFNTQADSCTLIFRGMSYKLKQSQHPHCNNCMVFELPVLLKEEIRDKRVVALPATGVLIIKKAPMSLYQYALHSN